MNTFLELMHWLFQISTPEPPTPTPVATSSPSFWAANGDTIIVAVVTAIVVLLLSEPLKALLKVLGGWLVRAWQAAGFGFKQRYLDALAAQHQWLKLIGIYSETEKVQPRLHNVFISLRLAGDTDQDGQRFAWDRLFAGDEKQLVILGHPGSGKSTLLDYLVLIFTGAIFHPLRKRLGAPVPLYARLHDLGIPGQPQTLLDLLKSPIGLGMESGVPAGFFERQLLGKNCIVFLDGLDEVLDPEMHQKAVDSILRFANTYPGNWIVITCRVAGWNNQLPGFRPYTVQDFDEDDIQRFIGNWYREVLSAQELRKLQPSATLQEKAIAEKRTIPQAQQAAGRLWNALQAKPDLLRIARTPLILSLITLVHKNRRDLPHGRAKLYAECLEVLLETWDKKEHDIDMPNSPPLKGKLLVLQTIALHFLKNDLLELDAEQLEILVQPLLPHIMPSGKEPSTAEELIRQIYQRSGVLEEKRLGQYGFAHRALHDYLSASAVVENHENELLLLHAAEERWREVILIAAWLSTEQRRNELIEALAYQGGETAASLALAGWGLAEGAPVGEHVRVAVRERLVERLEHTETANDLSLLTNALLAADSTAAADWMRATLTGHNEPLRLRTLNLLTEIGVEAPVGFITLLAQFLENTHEATPLRVASAMAIAKFDPEIVDTVLWNALQAARQPQNDDALKTAATWAWCELGGYEKLGMVKVPAGEFMMGNDYAIDKIAVMDELPQHRLYLPMFYIARNQVTVGQWISYLQDSQRAPEHPESKQGPEDHPVRFVTWHEALAYAQWYGFILPSEAEWEKAARGTDGRIYPWGAAWQTGRANTYEYRQIKTVHRLGIQGRLNLAGETTPVGQFSPLGDSPYGCTDMAGNVWEWTRSIFRVYPYDINDGRENLKSQGSRVLRGGSFDVDHGNARCDFRLRNGPGYWLVDYGFRVGVVSPISISGL